MTVAWKHIIVPVDFSDCSQAVLDYAAVIGVRMGARLEVMHVFEKPYYHGAEHVVVRDDDGTRVTILELVQRAAARELDAFMEANRKRGVMATARLVAGDPETEIVRASADCDLLVMGTHGRRGPARWLLGSIAEHVLRRADCPVLTIRAPRDARTHAASPAPPT
jgi:nucleotide-binding universal stress UspA family protein